MLLMTVHSKQFNTTLLNLAFAIVRKHFLFAKEK